MLGPMNVEPKLHHIAAAMADARRARMLCTLLDGRAFTNKELASDAGITPQTASGHLAQLQAAGLVVAEKIGRNVYHRLAGDQVADMLESLGRMAPLDHLQRARMARAGGEDNALYARSCYSHIAGRLGVAICEAMIARGLADGDHRLTGAGRGWAAAHGLTVTGRVPVQACLDWSERRPHLKGPLASSLMHKALDEGWLARQEMGRALVLSDAGRAGFGAMLGMEF